MSIVVVCLGILTLLVLLLCWLGFQLTTQNGRLLLRVEALEQAMAGTGSETPSGLAPGTVAHDFELPEISGGTVTLSQWRGRDVLLLFFDPECGYCRQMLPKMDRLARDPEDGRPLPLVISTGTVEVNRIYFDTADVQCRVLVQEGDEVSLLFRVPGTPSGYIVDGAGSTAGDVLLGSDPLLAAAGSRRTEDSGTSVRGESKISSLTARSRLVRDGLKAGQHAPDFRLPRIDGGELTLDEYRGQKLLLVFSDPNCEPCMQVAPDLQRAYQHGLQVADISRGTLEENRAKAHTYGLTFPIVVQHHWDTSRDYGMFATPIAYLIREDGVIDADVAVGIEPIRELAGSQVQVAEVLPI